MNRMRCGVAIHSRMIALALAAVLGLAGGLTSRADEPRERPNVLFIAADDLNDWVGFLGGHPQVKTPHLDPPKRTPAPRIVGTTAAQGSRERAMSAGVAKTLPKPGANPPADARP